MSVMSCPSCGAELPEESGQHALSPSAGVVSCPSCGATVKLADADDRQRATPPSQDGEGAAASPPGQAGQPEYFSGEESVAGVMEELSEKEGGPRE
jgi:predicted RNA-binding Zn-ribbon protein involved in translation (DUF1610 family)